MTLAEFRVEGRPRTKGSLKVYCTKGPSHKIHLEEEVAESKAWRARVARACREDQLARHGKLLQYAGPVDVRLVFFFPREESAAGGPIPTHDTEWPTAITLGDVDKLTRNVLDALIKPQRRVQAPVTSALILDDSQVTCLQVGKFWSREPDAPAGVQVLVLPVESAAVELASAAAWGRWRS